MTYILRAIVLFAITFGLCLSLGCSNGKRLAYFGGLPFANLNEKEDNIDTGDNQNEKDQDSPSESSDSPEDSSLDESPPNNDNNDTTESPIDGNDHDDLMIPPVDGIVLPYYLNTGFRVAPNDRWFHELMNNWTEQLGFYPPFDYNYFFPFVHANNTYVATVVKSGISGSIEGHVTMDLAEKWLDGFDEYYVPTYRINREMFVLPEDKSTIIAQYAYYLTIKYSLLSDPRVSIQIEDHGEEGGDSPPPWSDRIDDETFSISIRTEESSTSVYYVCISFPEFQDDYGMLREELIEMLQKLEIYHNGLIAHVDTDSIIYGWHPDFEVE